MNKKILIVDDVELSLEILMNVISDLDEEVFIHTSVNAYDAKDKINKNEYDLIVMDIMMPDGDGFELLNIMSEAKINSKIIILSGLDKNILSSASMLGKLYELNIVASLEKPFVAEDMLLLIRNELNSGSEKEGVKSLKVLSEDDNYPICLMYQPQIDTSTGGVVSFEILSRWLDSDGALLPPSSFLPLINQFNKQKNFTKIVMEQFVKDYLQFFSDVDKSIRFAINIDPNLLVDDDVLNCIIGLKEFGVMNPIVVELTENNISDDIQKEFLTSVLRLRLQGVELSIDDFGVDFSNVDRVIKLPINEIKVDKKITKGFQYNADYMDYIKKVVSLARSKNARVVYEGVETLKVKNLLEEHEGYYQQGYFHSVPILPSLLPTYLMNNNENMM
ncbi:EAL domain-containing protein [Aliivibrio fischeri]|uniref:EAL domain-containing response regulator n=1 Tax=Aliivibrio fischeri TaxID=668 RepID=UPI0012D8963E|nr:EAL domain-containing protein [Aliivibrio fischeri]MUL04331.1 EAL domain-containing protein [Aliivibrio fischeri]